MRKILFATIAALALQSVTAQAKLNVVTTTTDLEAIVKNIGAGKVDVISIAKGTQDPHQIEAKPSYMIKMRDSDLVIAHGLELESAWIVPLIQGARNPKIAVGGNGYLEIGDKINPIEIPGASATRAQGDVHPGGNPHFTVDPIRVGQAAVIIAERMGDLDPANKDLYKKSAEAMKKSLEEKTKEWKARIEKTKVKSIVTYHKTLNYFFDRFGIDNPIQLEPRPGIPPTAAHLLEVVETMKKKSIHLILIENLYEPTAGEKIQHEFHDAKIVRVPAYVGGEPDITSNAQLIERLVKAIEENSH